MNREQYNSDPRYAKVLETMDLLGIMDITTTRQHKNGTIVWKLPIKNNYPGNKSRYIEVASFSTGYVRNQNSGYSNYQLNKRCEGEPEYFKLSNGDYRKFTTRACVLIPIEIDRLEYLLKYCVKNYYIKNANQVPNGDFYPKWMYDNANETYSQNTGAMARIGDLEEKLDNMTEAKDYYMEKHNSYKEEYKNRASEVNDLQNKLNTIKRIASYE
jgi:hypothetical protein